MLAVEAHHERTALGTQRLERRLARLLELALKPRRELRNNRLDARVLGRPGERARDRA